MLINHARLWWPVDEMFTAHSFLVSWFTGGFQPEAHRWCTLRQDWPTSHMRQRASEGIEETLQETTTTHDPKVCQFILLYILLILLVKIFMTPFNPLPTELFKRNACTVETLYSTIYYSKYFIELNNDKSTQYVALWTHKRHPIPRPFMSTSTEIDRVIKGFYCITNSMGGRIENIDVKLALCWSHPQTPPNLPVLGHWLRKDESDQ